MSVLWAERVGSVSVMMAVMAPMLLLMTGVAVEVSRWTLVKQELQRAADAAAFAGALEYMVASNPQNAANAAADLIDLNGGPGSAPRGWNAGAAAAPGTLSGHQVTIRVGPGVNNTGKTGVSVTISQIVPLILTKALRTTSSNLTVTASAGADLGTGLLEDCLLSLGTNSGDGITFSGAGTSTLSGCSVHSNASLSLSGAETITTSSIWTVGTITTAGSVIVNAQKHEGSTVITDPYASKPAIVAAFAALKVGAKQPSPTLTPPTTTLNPGAFSNWNFSGSFTVKLNPGIYYVDGAILLSGAGSLTGSGVTIITSGAINVSGTFNIDLSAATTAIAVNGAIPGVIFAGNSANTSSFSGSVNTSFGGLVYYPNGPLQFAGAQASGSTGCFELVARSISFSGSYSGTAANCPAYGVQTPGDPDPKSAGLVK